MNNANTVEQLRELFGIQQGGDELTPGFPPGPSVLDLHYSQNLTRSKNAGIPDLVSKGQEVVVDP